MTLLIVGGFLAVATAVSTPGESAEEFRERVTIAREVAAEIEAPALSERQLAFESELAAIGEGFSGDVGIAVTEADTLATMSYQGEKPFPQQSVTKLWVALTALDKADNGALDLSEQVTIRREDLTLFYQPIRNIVRARGSFTASYDELLQRAITQSDNTANDVLLRHVGGPPAIEGFLRRERIDGVQFGTDERSKQSRIAGLEWRQSYSMGSAFYDARDKVPEADRRRAFNAYLSDPIDGASASGVTRALARLVRGDLLSEASTQRMLAILEETKSGPRRLKGGVPDGWQFGHKTGTGQYFDGVQSGFNDVGILTAPDGTSYAIAVFIGSTRSSYASRFDMMQSVTRAVARFHDNGASQPG